MQQEIPQALKDDLELIELEAEFRSHQPERPRANAYFNVISIFCLVGAAVAVLRIGDMTVLFLVLIPIAMNWLHYGYSKQLYEAYARASEIIDRYKAKQQGQ